ncbi:Mycobacterium rhizamassiliense ORFan [Mycobacterium rhizamassiliense]|uniref:Mycobacterium rhizamassiliense ORFan n=1 Tax=Mycobacterium rhizamassiliense TaxID=1841860 RepID=A0A2U3NT35_9MYCO|nr:hypothetical protein [Mycobacterium rhizamassiliense]SPM34690.1 Mycobacterium rhizamassiliense ORFan [Mycobacterium rhizamassiliense]
MTNIPSPSHDAPVADARRRQIRTMQLLFAGAAAVATLALFGTAQPGGATVSLASAGTPHVSINGGGAGGVKAVNDDSPGGVNDQGQTSGDIFTQNAQDQSTADGAGTS